jgi:hypothetical protein
MYKFIRNNQKKLMAVFGVILMIAFIVPTTFQGFQPNQGEMVVGNVGETKVTRQQVAAAEEQFGLLSQSLVYRNPYGAASGRPEWVPLVAVMLPEPVLQQIRSSPEMYYLLQHEARSMGLMPDLGDAARRLADPSVGVRVQNRVLSLEDLEKENPRMADNVKYVMADFMMVNDAFARAVRAVKFSQPMIQHELAANTQQIKSYVVDFAAKDFEDAVPTPDTAQLQAQFDRHADQLPGAKSDANPFGFGYKYPNRVKLQYLQIPREQVRKAVLASKD